MGNPTFVFRSWAGRGAVPEGLRVQPVMRRFTAPTLAPSGAMATWGILSILKARHDAGVAYISPFTLPKLVTVRPTCRWYARHTLLVAHGGKVALPAAPGGEISTLVFMEANGCLDWALDPVFCPNGTHVVTSGSSMSLLAAHKNGVKRAILDRFWRFLRLFWAGGIGCGSGVTWRVRNSVLIASVREKSSICTQRSPRPSAPWGTGAPR